MRFTGYVLGLLLICFTTSAFGMCKDKYFSTLEKAEARMKELWQANPKRPLEILVIPKELLTPCSNGQDQFYIKVHGYTLDEGDADNHVG